MCSDGDLQYIPIDGHYVCSHRGSHSSFRVLMSCLLKTTKSSRKQTNKNKQPFSCLYLYYLNFGQKLHGVHFHHMGIHTDICTYIYAHIKHIFFLIQHLLSSSYMLSLWDEINFPLESVAQTQPLSLVKALFSELK